MAATSDNALDRILRGKKGASATLLDENRKPRIRILRPFWFYDWGTTAPPISLLPVNHDHVKSNIVTSAIDFLPMFWGYYPKFFSNTLRHVVNHHPTIILGFNEPDKDDQSNISVEKALEAWSLLQAAVQQHDSLTKRILLVSPSCANPLGPWMSSFMKQVDSNRLQIDIVGVYHYGGPNAQVFQKRMLAIYEAYGRRPILITELGVADWEAKTVDQNRFPAAKVLHFMQQILPWMEAQDWIVGYNWFPSRVDSPHGTSSALYNLDGKLTRLGRFYAAFPSDEV